MVVDERPADVREAVRVQEEPDDLLAGYLPAVLRQDAFLANFLRIFDSILVPLLEQLDAIDYYFDPAMVPREMLPWLAGWLGEELPSNWPEPARRSLIKEAVAIHRARGTRQGLKRALELVTGREVLVTDSSDGLQLDPDARLGVNTALQIPEPAKVFVVICGTGDVDLKQVSEVIQRLKPAHADFSIRVAD